MTLSGSIDETNNIESSMNTDFIPELDHEEFVLQQQHDLGSPDLVSLREGLSTSDGPTTSRWLDIGQVLYCKFIDRDGVEVHKCQKNKYQANIQP